MKTLHLVRFLAQIFLHLSSRLRHIKCCVCEFDPLEHVSKTWSCSKHIRSQYDSCDAGDPASAVGLFIDIIAGAAAVVVVVIMRHITATFHSLGPILSQISRSAFSWSINDASLILTRDANYLRVKIFQTPSIDLLPSADFDIPYFFPKKLTPLVHLNIQFKINNINDNNCNFQEGRYFDSFR